MTVVLALLLGYAVGHRGVNPASSTQPAAQYSQSVTIMQSTAKPGPILTQVLSSRGSGSGQTPVFTVGKNWQLQWQCNPAAYSTRQYNLVVAVYTADGSLANPAAVNTLCKVGNTSGVVQESQGGKLYLDVFSQADWTVSVQAMK